MPSPRYQMLNMRRSVHLLASCGHSERDWDSCDSCLFNSIKEMNKCHSFGQSQPSTWLCGRPSALVPGRHFPSILLPSGHSAKPLQLFREISPERSRDHYNTRQILFSDKDKRSSLSQHAAKPQRQLREPTF